MLQDFPNLARKTPETLSMQLLHSFHVALLPLHTEGVLKFDIRTHKMYYVVTLKR